MNIEESTSGTAIDHSIKNTNDKKPKEDDQIVGKDINVGVQSLYHGIFATFQCHNTFSYNSEEKALIISLLMNHNWSKPHQLFLLMLKLLLGGKEVQRVILLHCTL